MMYKFSAPMPYNINDIDRILEINENVEKSAITSLYACVPRNCELFTDFEQSRNFIYEHSDWNYWKSLITHSMEKGVDFIYLLNNPRPMNATKPDFNRQLDRLNVLLNELRKIGVKKLRVASAQLMTFINNHYKDFDVLASTSIEYKTIWEYQNFISIHPEVKQIVPSHDTNKNFKLLSNLKKRYPDIEIEVMVNEGCWQGCPNRVFHEMMDIDNSRGQENCSDLCLTSAYPTMNCGRISQRFPIESLVIGNHLFPWEIDEYGKIGIENFKLVGRDGFNTNFDWYIMHYNLYLKGIDNPKAIENCSLFDLVHHLSGTAIKGLTVKEYRKYMPDIKHFVKNGYLCTSQCGNECKYCYQCAEKIKQEYSKQMQKEKIKNVPVCVMS